MMRLLAALCLIASVPAPALAQATIAGLVSDSFGTSLRGVAVTATSPALIEKTRSSMNIVPRTGGNTVSGSAFASGTGERLQGDNLTPALRAEDCRRRLRSKRCTASRGPSAVLRQVSRAQRLAALQSLHRRRDGPSADPDDPDRGNAHPGRETTTGGGSGARRSQTELRTSYDRIRDLGGRLLREQDVERSRIARELHDDISQQVGILAINLELLTGLRVDRRDEADRLGREAMDRLEGIARSVHDLSQRLHPSKLRLMGLVAALGGLQRELSQPDLAIRFSHDKVPPALPHELTLCLFRIAQEAVRNAIKHSAARTVIVHLQGDRDGLVLTITDDGRGFDVSTVWGRGLGLISMQERLDSRRHAGNSLETG